jgi:hypothetical protein
MKKQVKKLVLAKETLRGLDRLTLSKAAGGAWSDAGPASCHICYPDSMWDIC